MNKQMIRSRRYEENRIVKKYEEQCRNFGVEPHEGYKKQIHESVWGKKDGNINIPESKIEALNIYFDYCSDLGFESAINAQDMSTGDIWTKIILIEDTAIKNKFGDQISLIEDKLKKTRIEDCLKALYDQRIYPSMSDFNILLENADTEESIRAAFSSVGGDESLLVLSENVVDDDEEKEENIEY